MPIEVNGRIDIGSQVGLTPKQARELAEQILVIARQVEEREWRATKQRLEGVMVWDADIYGR